MNSIKDFDEWIDRSILRFMKLTDDPIDSTAGESQSYLQAEEENIKFYENSLLNQEQTQITDYFERLRNAITNYEEQVMYGSPDFRNELLSLIKDEYHIVKVRIEVKPFAKIKEFKKHVFVKEICAKSG